MHDAMSEQTVHLLVKISLLVSAFFTGVMQNISTGAVEGDFVDRAFDYSFTVGIMALFIIYMIFENWSKDRKKETTQNKLTELLSKNIEAINEFSTSNKDVAKSLERSEKTHSEALDRMTKAFEKLESKL